MFTISEVANMLGVSRTTIYTFINDSKNPLPVIHLAERTVRIKRSDLEKWVEKQKHINK